MVKFKIICTGWNCEKYIKGLCDSIRNQTYQNFSVSFVSDGSTDKTVEELHKWVDPNWSGGFWNQKKNIGAYHARKLAAGLWDQDYDVLVMLDMDDELLPNALELIAEKYKDPKVRMTYGNWINNNGVKCQLDTLHYSDEVHAARSYRKEPFRITHLRSFKKELWDKVGTWTMFENEENVLGDCEMLFRMAEMSGKEGMGVIETPIYRYNMINPERATERWIKKDMDKYQQQLEIIRNRPIWQG